MNELNKGNGHMIMKAQTYYKNKVEEKLRTDNARVAWKGLNNVMGRQQKTSPSV